MGEKWRNKCKHVAICNICYTCIFCTVCSYLRLNGRSKSSFFSLAGVDQDSRWSRRPRRYPTRVFPLNIPILTYPFNFFSWWRSISGVTGHPKELSESTLGMLFFAMPQILVLKLCLPCVLEDASCVNCFKVWTAPSRKHPVRLAGRDCKICKPGFIQMMDCHSWWICCLWCIFMHLLYSFRSILSCTFTYFQSIPVLVDVKFYRTHTVLW